MAKSKLTAKKKIVPIKPKAKPKTTKKKVTIAKKKVTKTKPKSSMPTPTETHSIACIDCGDFFEVDVIIAKIVCENCTVKKQLTEFGWPVKAKAKSSGPKRPAGWHFYNVFVDVDGTVFHKGVEQPKLKGTLEQTKPKEQKKKMTKREKIERQTSIFTEIRKAEKSLNSLVKAGKKRGTVSLRKQILKLRREVKKYL